jgi:serine/threonine protein kinase
MKPGKLVIRSLLVLTLILFLGGSFELRGASVQGQLEHPTCRPTAFQRFVSRLKNAKEFKRRFQIISQIAQTDESTVFLALDTQLQVRVVIKRARRRKRARNEFALLNKVRDTNPDRIDLYLRPVAIRGKEVVLELHPQTLEDRMDKKQNPEPILIDQAFDIANDLAMAIQGAHKAGISYGDLKPSNVLMNSRDRAVLSDFAGATTLGKKKRPFGTPLYYYDPERRAGQRMAERNDLIPLSRVIGTLVMGRSLDNLKNWDPEVLFGIYLDAYQFSEGLRARAVLLQGSPLTTRRRLNARDQVIEKIDPRWEILSSMGHDSPFRTDEEVLEALSKTAEYGTDVNRWYREYFGPMIIEHLPPEEAALRILRAPLEEGKRFLNGTLGLSERKIFEILVQMKRLLEISIKLDPSVRIVGQPPVFSRGLAKMALKRFGTFLEAHGERSDGAEPRAATSEK